MLETYWNIAVEACGLGRTVIYIGLVGTFYVVTLTTMVLVVKQLVRQTSELLKKGDH